MEILSQWHMFMSTKFNVSVSRTYMYTGRVCNSYYPPPSGISNMSVFTIHTGKKDVALPKVGGLWHTTALGKFTSTMSTHLGNHNYSHRALPSGIIWLPLCSRAALYTHVLHQINPWQCSWSPWLPWYKIIMWNVHVFHTTSAVTNCVQASIGTTCSTHVV